jgi:hypothetical protein
MRCPICDEEMQQYKEEPSISKRTNTQYKRTYYRCRKDDTWGRLEVPAGPMSEAEKQRLAEVSR